MDLKRYLSEAELALTQPSVGDEFDISINEVLNLETEVLESTEDGITLAMDDRGMAILEELGVLEDYEDPRDANEIGYIKTGARKGTKERDKWERWHRDSVNRAVTGMSGRKEGDKIEEEHDKSHGSPYDRGSADAYYGRSRRPHKLAPKAGGVQGEMELVPLTDPAEIAAYNAGYSETDDRKDWGESIATEGAEVSYKVLVVDPETYDKQTLEISAVTSSEAKEKAEGKGYKVLKVTDTLEDSKDLNHLLKLSGLAETSEKMLAKMAGNDLMAPRRDEKIKMLQARALEISDKIDSIVKQGGKVGLNDPLSQELDAIRTKIAKLKKMNKVDEAEYQGRDVKLGKPMSGDVKKYKVYVRDPKSGNVKKVNFGDKNMEIKRDNPARRKNFRARHNCSDKKDRTKAGYWSCRMWSKKPVSKIV